MSQYYDKDVLKFSLEPEQVFDLLEDWGGQPTWETKSIVSDTICHNFPGEGSHKLYYYFDTHLCHCYSSCGTFDIFDLCIKIMKIQHGYDWELYDAMSYIASYFGINGEEKEDIDLLEDWDIFKRHDIRITPPIQSVQLKEYNPIILTRFSYPTIAPWEKEGISAEVCRKNLIGYYAGGAQITIPHYDIDGRLVGIRGRTLVEDEANRHGKYRPLLIGKTLYNHPLSMNLYHLNKSKENIGRLRTAIVFEGEKSTLKYESWFSHTDISVACCGQSLSIYQFQLLINCGAKEIIIAFDRESSEEDKEKLIKKLYSLDSKYRNYCKISFLYDTSGTLLNYKDAPVDKSKEVFMYLLKNRIYP